MPSSNHDYPEAVSQLIAAASLNPLGPGRPNDSVLNALRDLSDDDFASGKKIVNRQMAQACRSGLFLLHNFLDLSHEISQDLPTAEGSYWHGIMHRREPDYSNAKYWFRRVGEHGVYRSLGDEVTDLCEGSGVAASLVSGSVFDPYAFVDYCAKCARLGEAEQQLAREIAWAEWRLLFDYCFRAAVGE